MLNVSNSTTSVINFCSQKKNFPNSRKGISLQQFEALQKQKFQNIAQQACKTSLDCDQAEKLYKSLLRTTKNLNFIERMKKVGLK